MVEDSQILRGIDWQQTFPFVHVFRSFRVAIHPSKLILALLALILLYGGGRLLDRVWSAGYRAAPGEIAAYQKHLVTAGPKEPFRAVRERLREANEEQYRALLREYSLPVGEDLAGSLPRLRERIIEVRGEKATEATTVRQATTNPTETKDAQEAYSTKLQQAYAKARVDLRLAEGIRNRGIFAEFFGAQIGQVNTVVRGVLHNTWTGEEGVFPGIARFFIVGPAWLARYHPLFMLVYGTWFLLVWAIFGGAISRIAAVHVARDEKISIRSAMRFSMHKILSFVSAPLLPLGIIAGIGFSVPLVGGLLSSIMGAGSVLLIAMSALFFLVLIAGFLMTLVLIGTVGGINLMYPTIAVEGSDSFDAISRSFSYVFARPWRVMFNTLVAVVYGAVTYFFVHFFIMMMLMLVHTFVGLGMFAQGPSTGPLWETIWPASWARLTYPLDAASLRWDQATAAYLIAFWVYLAIAMLGAYAISYYFSANTIVYYLLRQEVDATEMDDVYLEQSDEELEEAMNEATEAKPASAAAEATPPAGTTQG